MKEKKLEPLRPWNSHRHVNMICCNGLKVNVN